MFQEIHYLFHSQKTSRCFKREIIYSIFPKNLLMFRERLFIPFPKSQLMFQEIHYIISPPKNQLIFQERLAVLFQNRS